MVDHPSTSVLVEPLESNFRVLVRQMHEKILFAHPIGGALSKQHIFHLFHWTFIHKVTSGATLKTSFSINNPYWSMCSEIALGTKGKAELVFPASIVSTFFYGSIYGAKEYPHLCTN